MIFIGGITKKRDELNINQTQTCSVCHRVGGFKAFVEYSALSLFFIPVFKWNKKYYLESTCCGSIFSISDELGRDLEYQRNITIKDSDLNPVYTNNTKKYSCVHCGYTAEEDHTFCPKCGNRL